MCNIRKICVINQKGGVGKTTTAVSLASGLSRRGYRVLLIDMDPQGNVSHSLKRDREKNLYHFLMGECSFVDCLTNLGKNLDLIHSNETLTKVEVFLSGKKDGQRVLSKRLNGIGGYDYIIIDCAPSLGLLNQNAMLFSDEAIIPVSTNYLALTGLSYMIEAIEEVNKFFKHNLKVSHIIPTMHDMRNKSNKKMLTKLTSEHADKVTNPVRINSKLAEAPASGKSIFAYDPKSRGAIDYNMIVETIVKSAPMLDFGDEVLPESIPISLRVQKIMEGKVEFDD